MKIKPLDFVVTPGGAFALVTEVDGDEAAIEFIGQNSADEHNAWWSEENLCVIDSLPQLLARKVAHPFNQESIDTAIETFPIPQDTPKGPMPDQVIYGPDDKGNPVIIGEVFRKTKGD